MSDLLAKCTVCGALLDEEDLFCANCGTEAPRLNQPATAAASGAEWTCNFECAGCGASMSYDASAQTLRCPFCGSEKLNEQKNTKVLTPERVVPFAVERAAAENGMRAWLGKGWLRPGDLSTAALITHMQPVFVPYWVFQASTHTFWTADSSRTPSGARASWYPVTGEHRGNYAGLLIGASGALTPAETSAICPFDLGQAVPTAHVDLQNSIVEQFRVPRKYARPLATQGLEAMEREACAQYVPGNCRNVHVNVRLRDLASEPVLLPVWIMAYRYGDKTFRFLLNGQTGRATGEAPTAYWKIVAIVAIVLAVILAGFLFLMCAGAVARR